jgi:hypothetical protein
MAGYLSSTAPSLKLHAREGAKTFWSEQGESKSSAFSYLLSAGIKYRLGKSASIFVCVDYLSSKQEFKNVTVFYSDGTVGIFDFTQPITAFNLKGGFALTF